MNNGKGCIMKVTTHLSVWLMGKIREKGWSWREVGRRAGLSDMTMRRVATGLVNELESQTEEALCRLFSVSAEELRAIADGQQNARQHVVRERGPAYGKNDTDCDKQNLWAWVAQDSQRSAVLRAMGYAGTLPGPKADQPGA
jgi:DNA-binding Xre family transcriptional regulator